MYIYSIMWYITRGHSAHSVTAAISPSSCFYINAPVPPDDGRQAAGGGAGSRHRGVVGSVSSCSQDPQWPVLPRRATSDLPSRMPPSDHACSHTLACVVADRRPVPAHLPLAWTHSSAEDIQVFLTQLELLARAIQSKSHQDTESNGATCPGRAQFVWTVMCDPTSRAVCSHLSALPVDSTHSVWCQHVPAARVIATVLWVKHYG